MELHTAARMKPPSGSDTATNYLARLPLDERNRLLLWNQANEVADDAIEPASVLRDALKSRIKIPPRAPSIERSSMAPENWPPSAFDKPCVNKKQPHHNGWTSARWRRLALIALAGGQTVVATHYMCEVLPYHGGQTLEVLLLVLFSLLFLWVSAGFWTALMGFVQLLKKRNHHFVSVRESNQIDIAPETRTAIVMPICNEDVARVFAGLEATYRSLAESGELEKFDFYILSDSNDADCRVAEIAAWTRTCATLNGFGRIYYRWRRHHIKRKSGNVADFCRRWGARYEYMVVLDADSVMSGTCLTTLVRLMEANPGSGIIQTAPCTAGRDTLYARIQQFSSRVYGPLFVAGLHFWQLGESHYWGHNAIIRIAPFIRHCGLGRLPGKGALSGEILSHDFVEAALMRRAGWSVWIAYDLPGSYEESPTNLVEDLKRDRRWCYGNLMNFRLFPQPSFHPVHRAVFVTGAFSYLSAPLWFLFLIVSTALLATHVLVEPEYFPAPNQLFPIWPEWNPQRAVTLFSATAALLFAPRLLSYCLIARHDSALYGGCIALALSMLFETLISSLMAPIRMVFHSQFVSAALFGRSIGWKSPLRANAETDWREAVNWHGWHMLLGLGWGVIIYWLNPTLVWWWFPIVGALGLSIPISVYCSRLRAGVFMRRMKLLLIPEEAVIPRELGWTRDRLHSMPPLPDFVQAVVDPWCNIVVCSGAKRRQSPGAAYVNKRASLIDLALTTKPSALRIVDKTFLLNDPDALRDMHIKLWAAPEAYPLWHAAQTKRHGTSPTEASGWKSTGFVVCA